MKGDNSRGSYRDEKGVNRRIDAPVDLGDALCGLWKHLRWLLFVVAVLGMIFLCMGALVWWVVEAVPGMVGYVLAVALGGAGGVAILVVAKTALDTLRKEDDGGA